MSVIDQQPVNAAVTNAAFLSRLNDSDTVGRVGLKSSVPTSGAFVNDTQRALNKLFEGVGSTGEADTLINQYGLTNFIANGQSRKQALIALDAALKASNDRISITEDDIEQIFNLLNNMSGEGNQATLTVRQQIGIGDDVTQSFTLPSAANNDFAVLFVDGVKVSFADYAVTGTTVNFAFPVPILSKIQAFYFNSVQNDTLDGEACARSSATVYTYTKEPKSKDGIMLFKSGVYVQKRDYLVNFTTKQITFFSPVAIHDEIEIVFVDSTTLTDSYQYTLGTGAAAFHDLPFLPFAASAVLLYLNGVLMDEGSYDLTGRRITYTMGFEPVAGDVVDAVFYVLRKGNNLLTSYRTLSAQENTDRYLILDAEPIEPDYVLLDVRTLSFLVYGVDFTIDKDKLMLLATAEGNAVNTGKILRLHYKG